MTVRDHARLECDLSVIDRFLSNVFVINVYRELLRQPVSHNPSLRIDFFLPSFRSELPKATWLICMCVMKLDI